MGRRLAILESYGRLDIQKMLTHCREITNLEKLVVGDKYAFLHTETNDLHIGDLCVFIRENGLRVVFYPGAVSINLNSGCITRYVEKATPLYVENTRCFKQSDEFQEILPLLLEESVTV